MLDWFSYMLKKRQDHRSKKASAALLLCRPFVTASEICNQLESPKKKKKNCFCSQENRSIDLVECNDFASSCQFLSVFHLPSFLLSFFSWKIKTDCCHGKEVLCSYVLIGLGIIFAHTWMITWSIFHLYLWWF